MIVCTFKLCVLDVVDARSINFFNLSFSMQVMYIVRIQLQKEVTVLNRRERNNKTPKQRHKDYLTTKRQENMLGIPSTCTEKLRSKFLESLVSTIYNS